MDRPHVSIQYERTFPYPIDVAYAWLTDYQDDDPQRAGAMVEKRDVVRRGDREVEVDARLDVLGKKYTGRAVIHLHPEEHRWVAVIGRGSWQFHYRLEPDGPHRSRLIVDYRITSRRWTRRALVTLGKPLIRRQLDRMWDGFADAMERELGTPISPAAQ
ncbi:MAG TPA: SRPBCC family protein [Candidatus Thermoplasmatota archaeon]|nr:SRPBCC family protein [Candidatus Thermoplasmatota archaeon]